MEDKNILEFSFEEVFDTIKGMYNDEVAQMFKDQNIDGRALFHLAKEGTSSQYEACGLLTVGDQLRLKDLIVPIHTAGASPSPSVWHRKKPSVSQVKGLSDLNQRIYKAKRKAVTKAVVKKWPGNNIPTFGKTNYATRSELEDLVKDLAEDCCCEPAGFNEEGIKQHILDVLNERRRNVRNGRDYTQVDKRTIKRIKIEIDNDSENKSTSTTTKLQDQEIEGHKRERERDSSSGSNYEESEEEGRNKIPLSAARIIVQVAFNTIRFADISKKQLISAIKRLGLTSSKEMCTTTKEEAAQLLSEYLIEKKVISIPSDVNIHDAQLIQRCNIKKVEVF